MLSLLACIFVMLLVTEGLQQWRVYQTNMEQSDIATASTARSLAEQVSATIKTADTIAATLVQRVQADGMGPESRLRLYGLMTSLAAALPAIHEMGITDKDGNAVVKSLVADPHNLNYAERAYFQYHAAHRDASAFVGARIKSKVDGAYSITVSRRIDRADGSFQGVVVTSVSLGYFQQLFDQIQAKTGGVIGMVADDSTLLVRSPALAPVTDEPRVWLHFRPTPEPGNVTYKSKFDGVQRRGSFHRVGGYPLTILVAQSVWDLQRGWRSELRSHAIILACFLTVTAVLGGRTLKASRALSLQATHDGLTGLANRRSFDHAIEREFRRSMRTGRPVSIILMDLDYFKGFNDYYGHPAGDDCLRTVAHTVEGCARRAGELVARYGGEEIALILPGYDQQQAYHMAETIRLAVSGLAIPHAASYFRIVTASLGVACASFKHGIRSVPELIEHADTALYAAKNAGRDLVMMHPPVSSGMHPAPLPGRAPQLSGVSD